jgi:hypothetical protein
MKHPKGIPSGAVPVRDLGLHIKVQALQQLFVTLTSSLHPLVINGENGMETQELNLNPGVKTSIETALVQTCNRISEFMSDPKNWGPDNQAEHILGQLMHQAVADQQKKKATPRKRKGPSSEQK